MIRLLRYGALLFFSFIILASGASLALASIDLGAAKTQGLVGERPDGLIGIVSPPGDPELQSMVEGINAARLEKYRDVAQKQGIALKEVQSVAGVSLMSKTVSGQFVMTPDGAWRKVP